MNEILTSIFAFRQSKAPLFDKTTGLLQSKQKKIEFDLFIAVKIFVEVEKSQNRLR